MIAFMQHDDRSADIDDERENSVRFEPIYRRRRGEFPVRAHAARTRARLRSRGTVAARRKAREFNGRHRRSRVQMNYVIA